MAADVAPLPYLEAMVAYLQEREPAVWNWYGSVEAEADEAAAIRLELLKATVRLDPDTHGTLHTSAARVCAALGLAVPVTFYQSIGRHEANASLVWLPGEAHLVLQGDVLDVLDEREREAMIAHELGHMRLWRERGGAFRRAGRILAELSAHRDAGVSLQRSDAVFRQHCEIYCDRAAPAVVGELDPVVGCLVKLHTGLKSIDPAAYVRQADEIFGIERPTTQGLSHPEIYIRVRALSEWQRGTVRIDDEIASMLSGPLQLDRPALLDQVRLESLTRDLIEAVLAEPFMQTDANRAHARLFFSDAGVDALPAPALIERLAREVKAAEPSVQDYIAYVLLDFAAADPTIGDDAIRRALSLTDALGIRARFEEKAAKELKLTRKRLAGFKQNAPAVIAPSDGESTP